MRMHVLQHVPFEGPGKIAQWAKAKTYQLKETLLYSGSRLPECEQFDMLVVMGGPMGVYDEVQHPWLIDEKKLIAEAIKQGKLVLGVCLGAQLIAGVLGGEVYNNEHKEIGWFPVYSTDSSAHTVLFREFPQQFTPFHWHGDTFRLPPGATHTAYSAGCVHQAFEYDGRVAGLQFHLEADKEGVASMIQHGGNELAAGGQYVQQPNEMSNEPLLRASNELLFTLLNAFEHVWKRTN